jgi:hypothetical protein
MNVRRGLLRLWVVCSIAWIAFVTYDATTHYFYWQSADAWRYDLWDWDFNIRPHLEWAFGVPLAVLGTALVFTAAVRWIVTGFKQG